mmetsp:Transcript_40384/g.125668  ORF Transcript_40384/g.125668 Transcript_40384/m.125668 type:complete len:239 (-) Transcript_40384:461-1177(-)
MRGGGDQGELPQARAPDAPRQGARPRPQRRGGHAALPADPGGLRRAVGRPGAGLVRRAPRADPEGRRRAGRGPLQDQDQPLQVLQRQLLRGIRGRVPRLLRRLRRALRGHRPGGGGVGGRGRGGPHGATALRPLGCRVGRRRRLLQALARLLLTEGLRARGQVEPEGGGEPAGEAGHGAGEQEVPPGRQEGVQCGGPPAGALRAEARPAGGGAPEAEDAGHRGEEAARPCRQAAAQGH